MFDPCPSGRPLREAIATQRRAENAARPRRFGHARLIEMAVAADLILEQANARVQAPLAEYLTGLR